MKTPTIIFAVVFLLLFSFGLAPSLQAGSARSQNGAGIKVVSIDSKAPLIELKVMVNAGSAADPDGKQGLAYLTAEMILEGGIGDPSNPVTKEMLAEQVRPWGSGAQPSVRVAKEVTTFSMRVPRDVFPEYIDDVFAPLFTQPVFIAEELNRIRKETLEFLQSSIRLEDTESLGLLALDNFLHEGTAYGHLTIGTGDGLEGVSQDDLWRFYRSYYLAANVTVGVSTADEELVKKVSAGLQGIGQRGKGRRLRSPSAKPPREVTGRELVIVTQPNAISSGIHAGFPINITRGDPDYWALYVANVALGTHRDGFGRLYKAIRQARGYNYGDYSYIEWFSGRPFNLFPPTNTPRRYQDFTMWVRPVGHEYIHHILKAITWELEHFVRQGLLPDEFERAKNKAKILYLSLAEDTDRLLGYRLDDGFYGLEDGYLDVYLHAIDALSLEQVNAAVRKHLQFAHLKYVIVTDDQVAATLRDDIIHNRKATGKTAATYQLDFEERDGTKVWQIPETNLSILQQDQVWQETWLDIPADRIRIVSSEELFETASFLPE